MTLTTSRRDLEAFGYSSSSESESELPRKSSNPNSNGTNQKKKKKRKLPPQQSINKIWRHFSAKKFSRALAILPFDPVPLPAEPERPNELLSAGYERAVDECRRKVKKIIQECRRVNTRYRDQGWDIVSSLSRISGLDVPTIKGLRLMMAFAPTGLGPENEQGEHPQLPRIKQIRCRRPSP